MKGGDHAIAFPRLMTSKEYKLHVQDIDFRLFNAGRKAFGLPNRRLAISFCM